jgi:hypothetical protein
MALALIVLCIILGKRAEPVEETEPRIPVSGLWSGAIASFGLIFMIFFGFKSGFATATEISAFAAVYAIVIGSIVFRELSFEGASLVSSATRSGWCCSSSRPRNRWHSPHPAEAACGRRHHASVGPQRWASTWRCKRRLPIVMGRCEPQPSTIFGPALCRWRSVGIDPAFRRRTGDFDGDRLFAPPLGLGLYGACLIGNVPIEQTIKPIMGYLGLLLLCLLVIAFVPSISTTLPRAFGY